MTLYEAARLSEKDAPEGVLCLSISATLLKQLLDRIGDLQIERVDATPAKGLKINLVRAND